MKYQSGGSKISLREQLIETPSDFPDLFRAILRRDRENMEAFLLCILWILYAQRPLRPKEIYHAVWCGLSLDGLADSKIPDVTLPDSTVDMAQVDRYVIHSSKGLAEVTKSKRPTVRFIHESVRDFLIKDNGLHELWSEVGLEYESCHEKLKQCCSFYMNHTSVEASVEKLLPMPNSEENAAILTTLPFLEYASQNILYHANIAAKKFRQEDFLSCFRLHNWIKIHNAFAKYRIRQYTENARLIYVLAHNGHSELVRMWPKKKRQCYAPGERYKYPLFAALANGNIETVAALLDVPSCVYQGEDFTEGLKIRKDFTGFKNRTPLSWAAQEGCEKIIQLLLRSGEDIDETDPAGHTPLLLASQTAPISMPMINMEGHHFYSPRRMAIGHWQDF
jgi:hypothetical protein